MQTSCASRVPFRLLVISATDVTVAMTQVPSYSPLLIFILGVLVQVRARPESLTVLIVLDGFRHDYLDGYSAPHIQKLVSEGVLVPDVTPIFPASKWPNLASLITGHYPDAHNVLDTEVYDPIRNVTLHKNETEFWNSTLRLKTLWVLLTFDRFNF